MLTESTDLTFKHPELVAEGQDLSLKPGIRLSADDQDLQQESNDGVGEGEEHERRGSQRRPQARSTAAVDDYPN